MAAFKKQHYEVVAQVLKSVKPEQYEMHEQWENTCLAFLNQFKADNPAFDRDRFLKACQG
jgi:hypothetical protein